MNDMMTINVKWSGPHSVSDVLEFADESRDRGLYQIYGPHPVYGLNVLLYVGGSSRIQVGASAVRRCMKGSPDNGFRESRSA